MNPKGPSEPICDRRCQHASESKEMKLATDVLRNPPKLISIGDFLNEANALFEADSGSREVAEFIRTHPVDVDSLARFTHFDPRWYTRNLIAKTPDFEVILVCWSPGQSTPVHNHEGQRCWVSVVSGNFRFENFKWLGCDRRKRENHLQKLSEVSMAREGTLSVIDETDTIHRLSNHPEFQGRSMSLHIYSKPLDQCVVYDLENGRCADHPTEYFSIDGRPVIHP